MTLTVDIRVMARKVREQLGATQEAFAETLMISSKYYQQLESGWASPSLSLAMDMAKHAGAVEIERDGVRYVIQVLGPESKVIHLNRIDRSACTIMMKLAEELAEGAAAINKDLMAYINRIGELGDSTEALAIMYEQAIADVKTAIAIVDQWFRNHRPDVAERGNRRHREKIWERGYVQAPMEEVSK